MAHNDVDPAMPPRWYIGAVVLMRNLHGDVLMVKPADRNADEKRGWQLPGGSVERNEAVTKVGRRELREETGVERHIAHLLMVDQVTLDGDGASAEGITFVLDGGTLDNHVAAAVSLPESAVGRLSAVKWVPSGQLDDHAIPHHAARVRAAARAHDFGMRLPLHQLGEIAEV
ncbi:MULTISPECIES: NUDIX domain-containing protein [unclassified Streptomyces]|uniref:NUDIX domain-containing protein n=1 Tax=unclassified Streptomyces TaxID=2593676 RepID=UPI0037F9DD1A